MSAPPVVKELIERFEYNRDVYKSGHYNEAQVRQEFLNPLFEALGWDVENRHGFAEAYKDVVHEDVLKVGAATKAPDYSFRIGGTRKFFLEAKRPSVNIKDTIASAYQLRRYAWTAKLHLSILSDFEEFAVYDCRIRPAANDNAGVARTKYLTYRDYDAQWDWLAATFSKDAVQKGSFDRYATENATKRGTLEVDASFLREIERWREVLARNIALRNAQITQRDLNFAVQRIIDRIVFLRICEDRGAEDYGRLQDLLKQPEIYKSLCNRFFRADEKYNSGLFHFGKQTRDEAPDLITQHLKIDDGALSDVLANLYYPDSPYEFSVLSSDILGQVYECFLGKVIRLTPSHQAKIEEKPEVRKAGGVYYTPRRVVDHIVHKTISALLVGSNPKKAAELKILDPACGSGSFLLGAYEELLKWHLQWYVADGADKWCSGRKPVLFEGRKGDWQLTIDARKKILLNNIFGVDVDVQAVEVAKLSLLLKVLEGETEQSINKVLQLFQERALPGLGKNILCGNSLVGSEFGALNEFGGDYVERINPFDWEKAFPDVFARGGFDAVIGNPPYLSFAGRQAVELEPELRAYYEKHYVSSGWPTAHSLFVEKAVTRLSRRFTSFIVPDQLGHLEGYGSLRALCLSGAGLSEVRYWGEHVFHGVITPALTFVLDKGHAKGMTLILNEDTSTATISLIGRAAWTFSQSRALIDRLATVSRSLGKWVGDCGIRTTDAKRQVVELANAKGRFLPVLEGKRINRYSCQPPEIAVRLDSGKELFRGRDERFAAAKFLIRQTAAFPIVAPHRHAPHFRNSLLALFEPDNGFDIRYVVGLLNSRLLRFVYTETVREASQRTFPQVKIKALQTLPIRDVKLTDKDDRRAHDEIVSAVETMLALQEKILTERNPQALENLRRQATTVDERIDDLVFSVYALTPDERVMVEAAT